MYLKQRNFDIVKGAGSNRLRTRTVWGQRRSVNPQWRKNELAKNALKKSFSMNIFQWEESLKFCHIWATVHVWLAFLMVSQKMRDCRDEMWWPKTLVQHCWAALITIQYQDTSTSTVQVLETLRITCLVLVSYRDPGECVLGRTILCTLEIWKRSNLPIFCRCSQSGFLRSLVVWDTNSCYNVDLLEYKLWPDVPGF